MNIVYFNFKSPNYKKLLNYGFSEKKGRVYDYATEILNGQFELRVHITGGEVKTELIDSGSGEPYTLHLVEGAEGAFIGEVRAEFDRILTDIADNCFERDEFKSDIAHTVIEYVKNTYGDELEFLWQKLPTAAIWRRKDSKKWYGILMVIPKRKLGLDSDEVVDIIDLRVNPAEPSVVDGEKFFAGYHMNKKTWFTICLDGSVPVEEICGYIDSSYLLAGK